MHKFIYPTKDAWISELTSSQNCGGDEILEFRKDFNTADSSSYTYGVTRVLTQFDLTDISVVPLKRGQEISFNFREQDWLTPLGNERPRKKEKNS